MTAAVQEAGTVDLSTLATKTDLNEVKADIAAVKADLTGVKADVAALRREMATKAELAETKADILKWMFGAMAAQTGLIVALVKLLH